MAYVARTGTTLPSASVFVRPVLAVTQISPDSERNGRSMPGSKWIWLRPSPAGPIPRPFIVAKDPSSNRDYLNRQLALKFRQDPTKAIIPPDQRQKPEPPPVEPSIAVKDLVVFADPIVVEMVKANPQWKIVVPPSVDVLAKLIPPVPTVDEEGQPTGQTEHPGKVAQLEGMSKHQTDETGAQSGSGQFVPGMSGGAQGIQ